MESILVTGGAGFIGSNLVLSLQENGHDITVIDNFTSGNIENLTGFKGKLIEGDVSTLDLNSKLKTSHFDVIFHLASITDTTFSDADTMIRTNVEGFKNILNFAKEKKCKLIYASSASVYGRGKIPMQEDQELSPLNSYAVSKAMMDNIAREEIRMTKERGERITIIGLRYFNVYGLRESYKGKSASMIYQLFRQMKEGKRPRIFKYGEQMRDFIYVKDVTECHLKAMETEKSCIVNVATGVPTTFNRIIELLNQNLETNYKPEYFDNPYGFYQDKTLADTSEASKLLGFKAKYSIEDGIKNYVRELEKSQSIF
ncbi:MAG: ADP-glyceromanno-heptose 6-epimerase [Elusimicrobiota bacterium]|nr:ADP-glyceromanno-heptose 6-epimerase [Elusimicrobiota bacterium]